MLNSGTIAASKLGLKLRLNLDSRPSTTSATQKVCLAPFNCSHSSATLRICHHYLLSGIVLFLLTGPYNLPKTVPGCMWSLFLIKLWKRLFCSLWKAFKRTPHTHAIFRGTRGCMKAVLCNFQKVQVHTKAYFLQLCSLQKSCKNGACFQE